ncbi:MAG: leucine-rich repeat protein [Ruminococcus sp.]|nr:leucine-rich repeat protein [Ruminococcus sp.]
MKTLRQLVPIILSIVLITSSCLFTPITSSAAQVSKKEADTVHYTNTCKSFGGTVSAGSRLRLKFENTSGICGGSVSANPKGSTITRYTLNGKTSENIMGFSGDCDGLEYDIMCLYGNASVMFFVSNGTIHYRWDEGPKIDIEEDVAPFIELLNCSKHLITSLGSNIFALNDEVTCAVSKIEGNLEGDFYDNQSLNWKSSNESVLKITESKQDYSQCTVKAVGYGTSNLSFYVGSVKIYEATIKVGISQETLKDNSTLTLLKNAQKSGKSILSDYDAGDTAKVITFDVLTNLFDLAAEQLTVDFGGDTPEEKALDEVTQNIMKDYFGYNGSIEEQKLNSINEKWNCFKTAVKAVKKLRSQKKEAEAKKLAKNTIKQITKKGNSFGDNVINGFSKVSPYIDGAFTYYEIAMTAAMLQEFDKATVESLLNTFPKNTAAYTGLQRLYHDMTIGSEQYIVEKFTQETIISALSEFLEEVTFQGNEGLKEAYSSASGILSLVYEMSGGVTMKDISRARSAVAIAGNAYSLLSTNTDSGKREMIFNFCLSSIKVELENCIKVCKSSSASLKSSAQYYQGKVNKLTYEKYIKNCANEYTNPQGVSFENPDLEKYKISAKNSTNNKTSSPVGANEDESFNDENELIIPSSTEDYLVTSISENGFSNLEGITTIYVPDSIEEIGNAAFYNCVDTKSITLGNNVTYIGEKAFMNCSNLSSINLNANLITIKASAFENCSKLTSAVLGKELSELGNQAYANCESLSTVFVFNPSLVIPDTTFENCGNLTIYGYSGSTAEKYANSHNLSFESIGNNVSEIKVNYNGEPTVEQYGVVSADNLSLDITYIDGKIETITDGISVVCNTSVIGKQNAVVVYESGYTTFEVEVVSNTPTELSFDSQNYNIVIGDRIIPNITLSPVSTDYQVVLTSSDESIAKIEGNSIVAVGEGNAEITATTVDGNLNAKCSVTVGNNQAIDCSDGLFDPVFFIAPSDGKYSFSVKSNNATVTMVDSTGKVLEREEKAQNGILNFTETLTKDEVYLLFISSNENNDLIINSNAAASADRTDIDSMKVSVEGFEFYDSDYLQNVLANSKVTIFVNDEECYNDGTGTFVGENYTIKAADYKIVEQKSEFSEKPDIIVTLYFNESGYNWNVPKQVEFQLEYWDFNPQYQIGDTSLDGQISIGDVTAIQRHLAELALFTDEQLALADTNGDGRIDISDATHLQMYLAEYDVVLGKQ